MSCTLTSSQLTSLHQLLVQGIRDQLSQGDPHPRRAGQGSTAGRAVQLYMVKREAPRYTSMAQKSCLKGTVFKAPCMVDLSTRSMTQRNGLCSVWHGLARLRVATPCEMEHNSPHSFACRLVPLFKVEASKGSGCLAERPGKAVLELAGQAAQELHKVPAVAATHGALGVAQAEQI